MEDNLVPDTPTEEEQIDVLRNYASKEFLNRYCGGTIRNIGRVWTINRSDLVQLYVTGVIDPQYLETPQRLDGFYIIKESDGWHFYSQEKYIKFHEKIFRSKQEAIEHLANLRLDYFLVPK
jgi:hypothetical protein